MPEDGLNLFQIAVRVLFSIALLAYAGVVVVQVARYLGGILPARPRVLARHKRHIPWR
jgi:hypothetical protein